MANPERARRFATIPIYADSTGREVIPGNAVSVGDMDPVAESTARARALDERERALDAREHELNEYEHQLIELDSLLTARAEDDAAKRRLFADAISKFDPLATRMMDALEQSQRAKASADEFSLPPGATDPDEASTSDPDEPPGAGDAGDKTHGELTIHPATAPEDREELEALEDDEGPVPLSYGQLPSSYVKGEDEVGDLPAKLTKEVPPEPGSEPEFPGPRQPSARNPVGVSW